MRREAVGPGPYGIVKSKNCTGAAGTVSREKLCILSFTNWTKNKKN
jgi:hypothetical protein